MRLASDTGGTFTDLVVEDADGTIAVYKAPTTPADPVEGVLNAIVLAARDRGTDLASMLGQTEAFIHGTTHAINAIITGNTAKTALFVTQGHRDVLLFREGGRAEPFNQTIPYPRPFIARAMTFEVPERILASGDVLRELDEAAVSAQLAQLASQGVEAVAVALLWATINPAHEKAIARLIEQQLPGVPYSLSHEVDSTLKEFRRTSATAIDASLKPLMGRYLGGLTKRLEGAGFKGRVMVLTSAGGMLDAGALAQKPIQVVNSGPSMAPLAGRHYAQLEDMSADVIIADTGGTTYDISLVRDGHIPVSREIWVGDPYVGQLIGYPSVDVKSVGAGGGSVAFVDNGGLLHVGPESAGSVPGPVCYGRGGTKPTVSDACAVLGWLDPDFFLGGRMTLDVEAARDAIRRDIAGPLGVSPERAAWSIVELATESMVQAIHKITVDQGVDPAKAVLIGGGGAAGLNSTFIARRLGCKALLIPETGATMSAAGALLSDIRSDFSQAFFASTASADLAKLRDVIETLRERCAAFAAEVDADPDLMQVSFIAEARYENQVWDIDVNFEASCFDEPDGIAMFRHLFDAAHERLFSVRDERSEVEIIGIRAQVSCPVRMAGDLRLSANTQSHESSSRVAYFACSGWRPVTVVRFEKVDPDWQRGPAIIESPFTTIVVDPQARYRRSRHGTIIIES